MNKQITNENISNEEIAEIWKDIKGYEGKYQVSNLGRIKSLNYNRTGKEKILKEIKNKHGYLETTLCKNGKRKTLKIHRLVCQAFLEDYSEELEVDHIDTNKENNNLTNLRMCTRKENSNNELSKRHYSEAKNGKNLSEETKRKIGEAQKGKIVSVEARKKN